MENLYQIIEQQTDLNQISVKIIINAKHEIFKGHFPQQPVLPGVCQIEIITEILSAIAKKNLSLSKAKNIKFPNMIIPKPKEEISIRIELKNDAYAEISATIFKNEISYLKARLSFEEIRL